MMMCNRGILAVCLAFILVGCSKDVSNEVAPAADDGVVITQTIGGQTLYRPVDLAIKGDLFIIADGRDSAVDLYRGTAHIRRLGSKGQGPGQYGKINAVDYWNGLIAISSALPTRVTVIDTLGHVISNWSPSTPSWNDVSWTSRGTILFLAYDRTSPHIIKEYSIHGELLGDIGVRPKVRVMGEEIASRMLSVDGTIYVAYSYKPLISHLGQSESDWYYNYVEIFPFMRQYYEIKEKVERDQGGVYVYVHHGGLAVYGNYLIVAGPAYRFLVIDINNGSLRPVDFQSISSDLIQNGNATFEALAVRGDSLYAVSRLGSCLCRYSLKNILQLAQASDVYMPLDTDPAGIGK